MAQLKNKAYQYASDVVSGKVTAPKYVIKQCKQFIKIADDKDPKYVINKTKVRQLAVEYANEAISTENAFKQAVSKCINTK